MYDYELVQYITELLHMVFLSFEREMSRFTGMNSRLTCKYIMTTVLKC